MCNKYEGMLTPHSLLQYSSKHTFKNNSVSGVPEDLGGEQGGGGQVAAQHLVGDVVLGGLVHQDSPRDAPGQPDRENACSECYC